MQKYRGHILIPLCLENSGFQSLLVLASPEQHDTRLRGNSEIKFALLIETTHLIIVGYIYCGPGDRSSGTLRLALAWSQILNAWWSVIGQPMYTHGLPFHTIWKGLTWTELVLLSCVTIWGTRLFVRIASRSLARGEDDPRYDAIKKEPQFWRSAFVKIFLPEAFALGIIYLSLTIPFAMNDTTHSVSENRLGIIRRLGVGLFGIGFAMEVLTDIQLERHLRERNDLCRYGVWSLVRHPKYVG